MKTIKYLSIILLLFFVTISVSAQSAVDAGVNQTIYCSGSAQLKATPLNSWANLTTGYNAGLNSICFLTEEAGFAVSTTGNLLSTTDGGRNWVMNPFFPSKTLYSIYFINSTTGFITGASGFLLKTTDSGLNWSPIQSGVTDQLRSVFFTSATTGYIVGGIGTILKTTDGGSTWKLLTSGINTALYSVFFTSPETGYAAGMLGVLLKTTNAGATWTPQTTGISSTLYSIHFPTASTGFVTGASGALLKTTDGTNWSKYAADSIYTGTDKGELTRNGRLLKSAYMNSVYFTTPTTGYITGAYGSGSIFMKTLDGGTTWFELVSNVTTKMTSLCFPSASVGYAAGGMGRIAKISMGEMKPLTYEWYPTEGLSDANIANPVASPNSTTWYKVTASDGNNSFTDTVKVSVEPLTLEMSPFMYIGCEGGVKLDSLKTNYTGSEPLKYKWTPSAGLSNDTIANPVATVTTGTTYYLTVTLPGKCSASGQVTVAVNPLIVTATADKIVVCSGSAQLSAGTNYSGKSRLHYKWSPATGLSNDTIPNPVATVSSQTVYTVNVTSDTGCSASSNVTVKVTGLTVNAGADKTIQCGETAQLDAVTTNYNGTGVLRYKWIPATGLNNDTIANPKATLNTNTSYIVTVTAPSGCVAFDGVVVNVNPLTVNAGTDQTAVCGSTVQLAVVSTNYTGAGLKYKWTPATGLNNDTIFNPISSAGNISYTVTVTTPSGCTASDNVAIVTTSLNKPVINYVGINEKNKNILAWTKPIVGKVNLFNVYRETNMSNTYNKIGSVPFDSASVFVDANSNPDVQSNKYKISVVDACGSETALSDYHKTMHLSINKGINTIWNLIWEAYEGYPVLTYNIYRGTTPGNIQIIGSLSGSNTQFSDYTAPAGYVFYQIEAVSSTAASVKQYRSDIKSAVETSYSSRSNIATNKSGTDGWFDVTDGSNGLSVYPNPAKNSVRVTFADAGQLDNLQLAIYNSMGQSVKTITDFSTTQAVDVSKLSEGLYFIVIQSDNYTAKKHLLIRNQY